jgi:O-antigen/teichoic acid export membrane protein
LSQPAGTAGTPLPAATDPPSLRAQVVRGSLFEVVGLGAGQLVRLATNVVTTRLLFPEAFGLMALVAIVLQGLELFSDFGLLPSVVQNRRGDEALFLDTAWSIQVVRGFVLAAAATALAWPLAWVYHEPALLTLVPVTALSALIAGFNSTSLLSLRRHLAVGRLVALELAGQIATSAVMIGWALLDPSVWALVAGGIVRAALMMIVSHRIYPDHRNRFRFERAAAEEILHFGKWIFLSSAVHFVSRQTDRLMLGRFVGMVELGVYSVAVFLSEAFSDAVTRLVHGVLFPALSSVARRDPARLPDAYYHARLRLDLMALPALGVLAAAGPLVVRLLYDPRYHDAGWMLQLLAVRVALYSILTACETCLFVLGHTRYGFYRSAARAAWVAAAVPLGWYFGGLPGLVWATALSELPVLLVLWPAMRRQGLLRLRREALAFGFFAVGALAGRLLVASRWIP